VNDIICVAAQNRQNNPKKPILAFKVIEFGANREPVYDFLLVINSNLGPISHHYRDNGNLLAENRKFFPPPLL